LKKINSNFNAKYNYKNKKYYCQIIPLDNLPQLSNLILDKKNKFDFSIPKMRINRNDCLKLREKL